MKKDLWQAPLYLGGWLLFVALRLILGISSNGNSLLTILNLQLNTAGQIFRILSILFVIHGFVVLYLLLKRHKAFPAAYIILESLFIIINIYTLFLSSGLDAAQLNMTGVVYAVAATIISILWILYMLLSYRVKKTFVFNWNEQLNQHLTDKANSI